LKPVNMLSSPFSRPDLSPVPQNWTVSECAGGARAGGGEQLST